MGSKPEELIGAKITVSNLERSLDFYTRLVGLKIVSPSDAAAALKSDGDFTEIGLNYSGAHRDAVLVLMRRKGTSISREGAQMTWLMFKVPDAAGTISRLKAEGHKIRTEPTPYDGLIFALAEDPDGYTVELLQAESAE